MTDTVTAVIFTQSLLYSYCGEESHHKPLEETQEK